MKQQLTLAQSAYLFQRGVRLKRWNVNFEPIFNIADLIEILPKVLHVEENAYHYVLSIYWDEEFKMWRTIYDAIGDNIFGDCAATELIDSLYQLVVRCLDNGYINKTPSI